MEGRYREGGKRFEQGSESGRRGKTGMREEKGEGNKERKGRGRRRDEKAVEEFWEEGNEKGVEGKG